MGIQPKSAKNARTKIDVIVADDESDICEVLRDGLPVQGVSVRVAGNGKEAVLEALRHKPDAVLMDILMPHLSGLDAIGLFKIIEPLRAVPVLMLTALKSKEDVVRSMRAGAADYIVKPFDLKDAADRIRRVLAQPRAAPWPIFAKLNYQAASDGAVLRIEMDCDLTPESADDLAVLIRSLQPLQPIRVELDFEKVSAINGRPAQPLAALRDAVMAAGGEVGVTRFDAGKYQPASAGLIRSIFGADDGERKEKAEKGKNLFATSERDNAVISAALSKISGLRFDFKSKRDYSILDFSGELTIDQREKIDKALNALKETWLPALIRLDGLNRLDAGGMAHFVRRLSDLKQKAGFIFFVVTSNREIQKSYTEARGNLVTGVYEDLAAAINAL